SVSRPGSDADGAANLADHRLYHVESHAAAGVLGQGAGRGEAGQEEEFQQFRLRNGFDQGRGRQAALDYLLSQAVQVNATAVVRDRDGQGAGSVSGLDADEARLRLAGGATLVGRLQAVVHRVTQQVRQRGFELLQNVAVHLRRLALDLQAHLLV